MILIVKSAYRGAVSSAGELQRWVRGAVEHRNRSEPQRLSKDAHEGIQKELFPPSPASNQKMPQSEVCNPNLFQLQLHCGRCFSKARVQDDTITLWHYHLNIFWSQTQSHARRGRGRGRRRRKYVPFESLCDRSPLEFWKAVRIMEIMGIFLRLNKKITSNNNPKLQEKDFWGADFWTVWAKDRRRVALNV